MLAQQGVFLVERWSDTPMPADLPVVGQDVELPVQIGAYLQGGVPKVRLVWAHAQDENAF